MYYRLNQYMELISSGDPQQTRAGNGNDMYGHIQIPTQFSNAAAKQSIRANTVTIRHNSSRVGMAFGACYYYF